MKNTNTLSESGFTGLEDEQDKTDNVHPENPDSDKKTPDMKAEDAISATRILREYDSSMSKVRIHAQTI